MQISSSHTIETNSVSVVGPFVDRAELGCHDLFGIGVVEIEVILGFSKLVQTVLGSLLLLVLVLLKKSPPAVLQGVHDNKI